MSKLRNILKNLFLGLVMVWVSDGFAQVDKLNRAMMLYQAKNVNGARAAIDSVVQHPETKKDFTAWSTRAYIYYEMYKVADRNKLYTPLRDTLISSLKTSNALKPDAEYKANNNRLMFAIAVGYYKIARILLQDSINPARSSVAYSKSKELGKIVRPDTNFAKADVEYYNTVGAIFSDIFNKNNDDVKSGDIAKVGLMKVLEIQPDNSLANYNLGIMYYNQAVNLGKTLDYGADISQIDVIQENIVKLAKQSEQLVDKVYKKDPNSVKAIEALYFIYRLLNDAAKTELFKKECIKKGIKLESSN